MEFSISYPILIVFSLYILGVLTIGFVASRMTNSLSDYILSGRNLSGPLTALGAGASDMGGWLLMALPGAVFVHGINQIWMPIGLTIGAYLNWQFQAKRLRIYTQVANDSLTVPAYLDNRFHDHTRILRMMTALVILIFFTFYAGAGFVAGALLTQNITHFSYIHSLLLSSAVIIAYTCIGGFIAISWIDFFQGSLIFFALLIVPTTMIYHLDGIQHTLSMLAVEGKNYFDAFNSISLVGILSLLGWGLGYFGQPHIIVRFMAARSSNDIPVARFICMTWMILALYGSVFTGLAGATYFHSTNTVLKDPETVFLVLSKILFNPWIAGVLIAAVLSAIMSTVSAQLLSASSALTEDFYRGLIRPKATNKEIMMIARACVLIIAAIAIWMASKPGGTILNLVAYAWAGLGATFGPVVLISLYWRRMTRTSAIAGMITGAATVIVWEILGKQVGGIFSLYSIVPAFLFNATMIFIVSKLGSLPKEETIEQFDYAIAQTK